MNGDTVPRPQETDRRAERSPRDAAALEDYESASQKPSMQHPMANNTQIESSGKADACLVIALIFALMFLGVSSYFFAKSSGLTNEVVSALIPQPFTENNDFMFFHLHNRLKVLMVRPNQNLNQTHIGKLISSQRRNRLGTRSC